MTATANDPDRAAIEQRLRKRRQQLKGEIHDTLLRVDKERYTNIAGQLAESHERSLAGLLNEVAHADVARDVEEIQDIEGALGRLEAGTYGTCIRCGGVIPAARLDAYPTAKRCLACQQVHEEERAARQ